MTFQVSAAENVLYALTGLQDALDLIEFASGPADSEWGSVRNKMGRSKPWDLNYFAIGNEVRPQSPFEGYHTMLHPSMPHSKSWELNYLVILVKLVIQLSNILII